MKKLYKTSSCLFTAFILLLLISNDIVAQQNQEWSAITSYNTINSITQDSDGQVWGVSTGGLFSFDNGEFDVQLTPVEGMYRLDGREIEYIEGLDKLVIGYIDGMIDLFDPEDNSFERIEDIHRVQNFTSKGINSFVLHENRLYIAVEFGIVVYDPETFLVTESYTKIGSFDSGVPVLDLDVHEGNLYVATQQGVAVASMEDNLDIEEAWTNYGQEEGLPAGSIQSVTIFNDIIYASAAASAYSYSNNIWVENDRFEENENLHYRRDENNEFLIAHNTDNIYKLNSDDQLEVINLQVQGISDVIYDDQITSSVFAASLTSGMGVYDITNSELEIISPEGPNLNFFEGMTFDGNIFLSGTTRQSQREALLDNPKGYYIFDGDVWESFNRTNNETLNQNQFRQAFTSTTMDDYFYVGSWGRGIARHDRETDEITVFNSDNSTLRGWADNNPAFPVISGLETDSEGAVWAVSRYATKPLYVQLPGEDEWINYGKSSAITSSDEYFELFIDSNNQKWITLEATGGAGRGLLVLDTGEPDQINDSFGVKLTDEPNNGNLPDVSVRAIIEDLEGEIWVGTERGIARFIFPQFVITGNPDERRAQWLLNDDPDAESPYLLRDINVTSMAVNPANQKWVGTANQGVWLLNETGSEILNHFTTENSPLFSNVIREIEVFEETGEVFISTELGLSVYSDTPVSATESMEDLKVYPNPFLYENHNRILIEGLSDVTMIRILGVDGKLIRSIDNRGGRAEWNGLDAGGRQVGSGVYIVVALGPDGDERGVGKVMIVR